LNGTALKTGTTANNFNFNTTTQAFVVGGSSSSSSGQAWGSFLNNGVVSGNGAGFGSGLFSQAIADNGSMFGSIPTASSTLTATLVPIPFEFSPALGLSILGGAWFLKKYLGKKSK